MPGIALMHQLSAQRGSYYFYPHFSSKETEAQPGVTWLVIRAYAPRPCDFWGRLPQPWSHYGHWSSYMSVFSLKEGTVFVYGHAPTLLRTQKALFDNYSWSQPGERYKGATRMGSWGVNHYEVKKGFQSSSKARWKPGINGMWGPGWPGGEPPSLLAALVHGQS